jgi:hypothetical protein
MGSSVVATWNGDSGATPFYFCGPDRLQCVHSFTVTTGDILSSDFYPGRNDVIIFSKPDGLYATGLDARPPQNTHELLSGKIDFREDDQQRVFVKDKASYYELLFTASSTQSQSQ